MTDTLAFELYRAEADARQLPPEIEGRLRQVLAVALAALGPNPRPPRTAAEFTAFAETVATSLARHNFVQPGLEIDWVDSLGQVLTPVPTDHPRLSGYVRTQHPSRALHLDNTKPYYFLDCDMAALILISVADMVGFEVSLVEIPKHNFVRWRDPSGRPVNWDWTRWGSFPDSDYSVPRSQMPRNIYLRSLSRDEGRGYFLGVLTIKIPDPGRRLPLARRALAAAPNVPTVANNVAWDFATIADGPTADERQTAVSLSLSALAANPSHANFIDTVACAYAAAGDRTLGAALEQQAIRLANPTQAQGYQRNLTRIQNGELCQ